MYFNDISTLNILMILMNFMNLSIYLKTYPGHQFEQIGDIDTTGSSVHRYRVYVNTSNPSN